MELKNLKYIPTYIFLHLFSNISVFIYFVLLYISIFLLFYNYSLRDSENYKKLQTATLPNFFNSNDLMFESYLLHKNCMTILFS